MISGTSYWSALAEASTTSRVSALRPYSARRASIGEIRLALSAGINEAKNAENPNAATAVSTTKGSYGFIP